MHAVVSVVAGMAAFNQLLRVERSVALRGYRAEASHQDQVYFTLLLFP